MQQEGCTNNAIQGGVCVRHGITSVAAVKDAQNKPGKVKHGAQIKTKTCTSEGCKHNVAKGGVCARRGSKRKTCSSEVCT